MIAWMRLWMVSAFALALIAAPAAAQSDDPIRAEYEAYQRALSVGDMQAAEAAAVRALAASEARDGAGGRTAVLAVNLASARISLGQRDAALAPAQRAREAANGEFGVTPQIADLLILQTALDRESGAAAALSAALLQAADAGVKSPIAYEAATDLGQWLHARGDYEAAQAPWVLALDFIDGDTTEADTARAYAYTGLGSALMSSSTVRAPLRSAPETGTRILLEPDLRPELGAWRSFSEAMTIAFPHLTRRRADGAVTPVQHAYAQAMAWRTALRSSMQSRNITPPAGNSGEVRLGARNLCPFSVEADPQPRYPASLRNRGRVGAVVLRIVTIADGSASSTEIVAAVGGDEFSEAVGRVASRWRVRPAENAPEGCTLAGTSFVPIGFIIR